ncbi:MAG TPA: glutamine-hydrolyzing carbamoyl-phosphate synthase small subunit [Desulfobacteria bacterium]|nr:glutamine-hydrolyzing carbamoyl-phosphate synthase small subunit [Desulfobacteria bacterium]
MKAALVLANGTVFWGESLGAVGTVQGEVVFNTGMTGYQEVLTDPSYAGQIVTMTYPLMGNYGVNTEDDQSGRIQVKGFLIKEDCAAPSNWRCGSTLNEALASAGIIGLKGIDTRDLTKVLRVHGTLKGVITNEVDGLEQPEVISDWAKRLQAWQPETKLVEQVTTPAAYSIPGSGPRVVVMDFGIKGNILEHLKAKDFDLVVVPGTASAQEILTLNPQGLFLSNGPGDPKDVPWAVETIKQLLPKLPTFAICLGHQLTCLALGGDTYKLKFGHRGANQPVQDLKTKRAYITSQNHGYAVEGKSLAKTPLRISHLNLNDNTVEGVEHRELPVFSVQYHPEAGPGPSDSVYLFDKFSELMSRGSA